MESIKSVSNTHVASSPCQGLDNGKQNPPPNKMNMKIQICRLDLSWVFYTELQIKWTACQATGCQVLTLVSNFPSDTLFYQQEAAVTWTPHQERTCWKWTYHCRVAGVEWGLDALLFSFSSSVKGKKKELPSVGKVKGFSALPKFPQTLMLWKQSYFDFSNMLDFLNEKKGGTDLNRKLFYHFAFFLT